MADPAHLTCWILTDGKAGHLNQCLGLAEALELQPEVKRLSPRCPWSHLPPRFWIAPLGAGATGDAALSPPWPDLLIAAGRQTVAPAAAVRRAAGPSCFAAMIQDPGAFRSVFDLVIAPAHDELSGANVFETDGALTRITDAGLREAADRLSPRLDALPRPLVAVLVGGSSRHFRMTAAAARSLADGLRRMCEETGAGLAITASRRTGTENTAILRDTLAGAPVFFWDGAGDNPYQGMLGLADAIVVTEDSVSMISDACTTGKPVYIAPLEGGSAKFSRFHDRLRARGAIRTFDGSLDRWQYAPLDDTGRAAAEIRRRMQEG